MRIPFAFAARTRVLARMGIVRQEPGDILAGVREPSCASEAHDPAQWRDARAASTPLVIARVLRWPSSPQRVAIRYAFARCWLALVVHAVRF